MEKLFYSGIGSDHKFPLISVGIISVYEWLMSVLFCSLLIISSADSGYFNRLTNTGLSTGESVLTMMLVFAVLLGVFVIIFLCFKDSFIAKLISSFNILIALASCIFALVIADNNERMHTLALVLLLIGIAFGIFTTVYVVVSQSLANIVRYNLKQCYITVKKDSICGIAYTDIYEKDNGHLFNIDSDDVVAVRADIDAIKNKKFLNLFIEHTDGEYALCVESPTVVKHLIEDSMNLFDPLGEVSLNRSEAFTMCRLCKSETAVENGLCSKCAAMFRFDSSSDTQNQ